MITVRLTAFAPTAVKKPDTIVDFDSPPDSSSHERTHFLVHEPDFQQITWNAV
jgi:hypothetical protein